MALNDEYMLSPLSSSMSQMADLLQAEQLELDRIAETIDRQRNQLFICSCDTELARYERIFALPTNTSLSTAERRTKIIAKLNARGAATPKAIKDIVSLITGCPCQITEHFSEYRFSVNMNFTDKTLYHNFTEVSRQLCEIKPAHLAFDLNVAYAPLSCHTDNDVKLISLRIPVRLSNFGVESISLNGKKSLDGSWALKQVYTKGITFKRFQAAVKALNLQSTSAHVTADTMYLLDGAAVLDGHRKMDADIIRSEL